MMNPNLTLVVQALHFLGAYVLIERLLLRPAIAIIAQEDEHKNMLERQVSEWKERVAQAEREKQQQWRQFQELFARTTPRMLVRPLAMRAEPLMIRPFALPEPAELERAIEESTNLIILKVDHVRS